MARVVLVNPRGSAVNIERGPRFLHQPRAGGAEALQRRIHGLETAIARRQRTGRSAAGLQTAARRARAVAKRKPALSYAEAPRRSAKKNPARKTTMAKRKRSAAQKSAFARMRAGLAAYLRRKKGPKKAAAKRTAKKSRARKRKATVSAVERTTTKRRNPNMARKKRHSKKRRNPARTHRRSHARRNPGHHHRRRRRNPGISAGGAIKSVIATALPAVAGGLGAGFMDARITGGQPIYIRMGAKVGLAALGGILLRKKPQQAAAFMGAMLGSAGYEAGVRAGGGVIATSKGQGMRELASLAAEDEESMGILQEELQGMGLLTEVDGMGDADMPELGDAVEVVPELGDEDDVQGLGDDDE